MRWVLLRSQWRLNISNGLIWLGKCMRKKFMRLRGLAKNSKSSLSRLPPTCCRKGRHWFKRRRTTLALRSAKKERIFKLNWRQSRELRSMKLRNSHKNSPFTWPILQAARPRCGVPNHRYLMDLSAAVSPKARCRCRTGCSGWKSHWLAQDSVSLKRAEMISHRAFRIVLSASISLRVVIWLS